MYKYYKLIKVIENAKLDGLGSKKIACGLGPNKRHNQMYTEIILQYLLCATPK